jgi:hypothetical protein
MTRRNVTESLSQVASDLASLGKSVEFVGNQVKTPPATPDKFYTVMSEFYSKASQQVSMLESKLKKTQEAFTKTAEYYGEPPATPAEQLFNTVWAAVQSLERAKVQALGIQPSFAPSIASSSMLKQHAHAHAHNTGRHREEEAGRGQGQGG